MKIQVDIDIDVSNTTEQKLLQFLQEHPIMGKSLLLCGYLMVDQGVCSFYDEKYKNNFDSIWRDRFDKTLNQKNNLEEELSMLKTTYDERYTRLYEVKLQSKDDEIRRILDETEKAQNSQLAFINNKCSQLENELTALQTRMRDEISSKVSERLEIEKQVQDEFKRQNEELKERCRFYEEEYRNAVAKTTDYAVLCLRDSKVFELENEVSRLKTELKCFTNSNIYKGLHGEKVIRDVIANHFTQFEVLDTSKTGGSSDVHVITEQGDVYVFESKNKAAISLQDVEKSYADVELLESQYGDKLKGYIFVSHRTKGIPKKGSLYIERKNNIHIAWIGVNETDTSLEVYIVTVIRLLLSLAKSCGGNDERDVEFVTSMLKDKLNVLSDNIKVCSAMQDNLSNMALSLNTLQNNNKELYDNIFQMSGLPLTTMQTVVHVGKQNKASSKRDKLQCSHCNMIFKRKCDLTLHLNKQHCNA